MTEAELIRLARQGDQAAWEMLMRVHQEAAFRLAYLILGDSDRAEDSVQEAYIRAYRAMRRFDETRAFRPWLLSITAHQARNELRSAGRYLAALRRLWQDEPVPVASPETDAAKNWESQLLWQAVRRLALPDQQVIYYRFFLNLPVDETAQALGIAEGTVKSRLHRAVDRLREVVEREFPALQKGIQP